MFLCIEFNFIKMPREIWGYKSNFQIWNTLKPNAAKTKATMVYNEKENKQDLSKYS